MPSNRPPKRPVRMQAPQICQRRFSTPSQNMSTAVAISSDTSTALTDNSISGQSYQLVGTGLWWNNNCVSVRAARDFCLSSSGWRWKPGYWTYQTSMRHLQNPEASFKHTDL